MKLSDINVQDNLNVQERNESEKQEVIRLSDRNGERRQKHFS